jgi:glutamate racemase
MAATRPLLVFDSGVGGLSVLRPIRALLPEAPIVYAADSAGFPYGTKSEAVIEARIPALLGRLAERFDPRLIVIACNTASTIALDAVRNALDLPIVGTVPAIKPAAERSASKRFSVLATPGTVARDYTRGLVEAYAGGCRVTLIGSRRLASLAEAELTGAPAPDEEILAEIAPCFVADGDGRTDVIVLACTHYPLLLPRLERLAPWPVTWIDPAPAIARRVVQLVGEAPVIVGEPEDEPLALFTAGVCLQGGLRGALARRGFARLAVEAMPLDE